MPLFFYLCPEHVEEQGGAGTEGVQLPEVDGLQGASTNRAGASGIIFFQNTLVTHGFSKFDSVVTWLQ